MEVVVTSRHCEISDRFRAHAAEKLTKLEKHDHRIIRVHVEVDCEPNPRQHDQSVHVELTAFSKGPVIRAEAAADDKMGALDLALDKMASQMRKAADRRRVHRGTSLESGSPPPACPQEHSVARVVVDVMPKPEILDPQGKAVLGALPRLGFSGVTDVRQGKRFELEIDGEITDEVLAEIDKMAESLLSNPVIENYEVHVEDRSVAEIAAEAGR